MSSTITAIPFNDRIERFIASAGQTVFPFDFPLFAASDLRVTRLRAGAESVLVLGADYTVTGAGQQPGGSITLTTGALAGDVLVLESAQPIARQAQLTEGGDLPARVIESDFNRLYIALQQLALFYSRTIRQPATDAPGLTLPNADARRNRLLGFDSAGAPIALPTTDRSADTVLATGTTTARNLAERNAEVLRLRDFGAIGNGVADDTAAIDAWLAAVQATGKPGYFGEGVFRYTGTQLVLNVGGLAATQGGILYGAGGSRTVLDVSACTGTPQFLMRCAGNFLFYWTLRDFEIRGNRDGVMAQFGRDWTGSAYPDGLNSCTFENLVFRNNSTGTNAVAVRFNLVLETTFHCIANNGNNAALNGTAIELRGVQFCSGKFAGGNAQYGLGIYLFTFGNYFNCDLEVLRTVVLVDSASGWNTIEGQMVWGAPNANPALSGLDGTTTAVVATQAGSPLVFGHATNWSSATVPSITGAAVDRIWLLGRGRGVQTAEGFRFKPDQTTRDATLFIVPPNGQSGWLQFIRNNAGSEVLRWIWGMDTGNNLVLQRYNGAFQRTDLYVDQSNGLVVIEDGFFNTSMRVPVFTLATLPSAGTPGRLIYVSNATGGAVVAFADGTNWRRISDRTVVN